MSPRDEHHNWHVVYTCPNSEKRIYNELEKRKMIAFLPTMHVVRQWCDRKKRLVVPLFPNYVFVKVPPKEMWMVLMVNGVVRFVSFNGAPAVVRDCEIDLIKRLLSGSYPISSQNYYSKGEKVQVKQGPLAGLMGRVVDTKGITRLYVELETLHQCISVDIDSALLGNVEEV